MSGSSPEESRGGGGSGVGVAVAVGAGARVGGPASRRDATPPAGANWHVPLTHMVPGTPPVVAGAHCSFVVQAAPTPPQRRPEQSLVATHTAGATDRTRTTADGRVRARVAAGLVAAAGVAVALAKPLVATAATEGYLADERTWARFGSTLGPVGSTIPLPPGHSTKIVLASALGLGCVGRLYAHQHGRGPGCAGNDRTAGEHLTARGAALPRCRWSRGRCRPCRSLGQLIEPGCGHAGAPLDICKRK